MLTRRQVLVTAGSAAAVSAAGLAAYGYAVYIEPHWVETVHRSLPVTALPPDLEGRTFVQLSDIHVGHRVDDGYLLSVFDHVRSLDPDIVVITGDFISHHRDIVDQAARVYPHLPRGRLATAGIFGNHDYGRRSADHDLATALQDIVDQAGLTILQNQDLDVEGLRIIGLDDRWGPFFDPAPIMATVNAGEPVVVLSHNPDTADLPFWGAFDGWILAGHTHGGQCRAPFLPPPLLPVMNKRYVAGAYALAGNRSLYINRGVGHLLQARFNVRPEVTVFSLTKAV
jgi:predicted MPP superfamily phosphohydrolase